MPMARHIVETQYGTRLTLCTLHITCQCQVGRLNGSAILRMRKKKNNEKESKKKEEEKLERMKE
jgi:hypothetical protein